MVKNNKRMIGDLEGFSDETYSKAKEHKDIFAFCESVYKDGYIPKNPRVAYMKKYWINVDCGEPDTEDGGGYEDYQRFQVPYEVEKGQRGACKIYICDAVGSGYCEDYEGRLDCWYEYDHPVKAKFRDLFRKVTFRNYRIKLAKQMALYIGYKKVVGKLKKEFKNAS